ncbi:MAG: hypothetical protein KGL35_20640 [Bradyrhizobium sp.]|nr:hypothetical protein [Bradyrhizobium sp.]
MTLISDKDCVCHHVGYCDGSCQHPPVPEVWVDCPECRGEGEILETIHVYEAGCGFSHPDVYSKPCRECNGAGGWIDEVEADHEQELPCPACGNEERGQGGYLTCQCPAVSVPKQQEPEF